MVFGSLYFFKKNRQFCFLGLLLLLVQLFFVVSICNAEKNSYNKYESENNTGYFDLLISLDWDPSTHSRCDVAYVEDALDQFAKSVYIMTDQKHKLRNLYVYTNGEQANSADICIDDDYDGSYAHTATFLYSSGKIQSYTGMEYSDGTKEERTPTFLGQTLAHEWGHYTYKLYDEYKHHSRASSNKLSKPLKTDDPKDTIMNKQQWYERLSLPSDYADENERDTAHYRVYEQSAWETLATDSKNDLLTQDYLNKYPRKSYDEFESLSPNSPSDIFSSESGYDDDLEILWVEGNYASLAVDKSGSMGWDTPTQLSMAVNGAKQFVDMMVPLDHIGIISFSDSASILVPCTQITSDADKEGIKSSLDSLSAGGGTNFTLPLQEALSMLNSNTTEKNNRYVVFLSDGQASEPNLQDYIDQNIAIYTIGLGSDVDETVLGNIAQKTGGSYYYADDANTVADVYARINANLLGKTVFLAKDTLDLITGGVEKITTYISSFESSATFRASWEDGDDIAFSLVSPSGTVITSSSMPAGVTYYSGSEYGLFEVDSPEEGAWTLQADGTSITGDGEVALEASGKSDLSLQVTLLGGNYPEPISINATFAGDKPVLGANVIAQVTVPDGADPIADIILKDDGVAPDVVADDGIYSGVISNYSADGRYKIRVTGDNAFGTAVMDSSGMNEAGADSSPTIVGDFERVDDGSITASGYTDMPNDPVDAYELTTDSTKQWVVIEDSSDTVWFYFTAEAGQTYYLQTANIISDTSTGLETLLDLYESDASTLINSSSEYNDTLMSYIEFTATESDDYYIKLQSNNGATGRFTISAGESSLLRAIYNDSGDDDDVDGDAPSGGGGGGGGGSTCFISSLFW